MGGLRVSGVGVFGLGPFINLRPPGSGFDVCQLRGCSGCGALSISALLGLQGFVLSRFQNLVRGSVDLCLGLPGFGALRVAGLGQHAG